MQEEIRLLLKSHIDCWDKLSSGQQQTLIDSSRIVHYSSNDFIHASGSECMGILFVKSGSLRIYINSVDGREVTLYRLNKNDLCLLAATCVLQSITFDIYIDSITDSDILIIAPAAFAQVMKENIYLEAFAYKEATERFADAMWTLQQILFMSFDKRLALFLLSESKNTTSDTLHMTHEQIAKLMGSAREVVSRMLKYFSTEGLVHLSRGQIKIIDKSGLNKLI
ncbi:Crp/Fnr family transcriptional regulator [Pectinatus brassicae]|uniref:CRP/FNR family transcriptional regulator n=1 Tax=Pectinatus brassicae TaxID=862415 RepID=A0A840UUY2_9FIRM|nr:Crp/Fnr family transcriptional regulator [Pectinatus brassicae]MBB5336624.1 CRP/FNR family transcriptional regulator [Pectinatus brassicae]